MPFTPPTPDALVDAKFNPPSPNSLVAEETTPEKRTRLEGELQSARQEGEAMPVSRPTPQPSNLFTPYQGTSDATLMPEGQQPQPLQLPRVGFTPQPDDAEPVGKMFGVPETITDSMTKGSARKAGAIIANAAESAAETVTNPMGPVIVAAAMAAPEVVIPILTAQMAKSGGTKLAEGITALEQGRNDEGVAKIGEASTELLFAAAPALGAKGFAGEAETLAPRTTEALKKAGVEPLKSFMPARVQAGERAGFELPKPADLITESTKAEPSVEEIEPFGTVRQFRVTKEFFNPDDKGTYKVGDVITEPQLTKAGLPVPEPSSPEAQSAAPAEPAAAPEAPKPAPEPAVPESQQATSLQSTLNPAGVALAEAKTFSDLIKTQAFRTKGFRGLDVPSQRVVKDTVFRMAHDPQVLDAVIKFVPVDVMNKLLTGKLSAKVLLHDPAMHSVILRNILNRKNEITAVGDTASSSAGGVTKATTKGLESSSSDASGIAGKITPAVVANEAVEHPETLTKPVVDTTKIVSEGTSQNPPIGEGSETGAAESRIRPSGKPADIFSIDEGDLRDLLSERFPEPPKPPAESLEARRPGAFEFPSYTDFKTWMDARYAELDHEGMRLAFSEAPTANKVAYIKDNLTADEHKKAWITNLATGAILPTVNPPITRTTPRPMPGGGIAPAGPGAAYPQPPPPPPRAPSVHPKFDITALVQLLRQFDKFPVMNERLRQAYGRFLTGKELVELKERLLWDTKLAEEVLGHEIGHFIDLIVPMIGKGKQFGERLRLLTDFTGQMWRAKELRSDAKSLSRQWRGPFADGDNYRDTAKELMADFMSAMLHDPEFVNQHFPRLYDAFSEFRTAKPQFDTAYREIETWLQGGTVAQELIGQDRAAVKKTFDIINRKPEISKASIADRVSQSLISLWSRAFQKEGKPRRIGESITEKLETSYMWAAKKLALWSDSYVKEVQPHLDRISDDPIEAHTDLLAYSKAVRTIGERRAAGVWIEQNPAESRTMLEHLLGLDDGLRNKFSQTLASAPDTALYDLSAAIFREIHDRGDRFVARMAREIDSLDLGVDGDAALIAFNVRGKLLNPGGQSVPNSQRMIEHLRDKLGPDKFAELESGARALRGLMHDVQREMYDAGLISKKAWDNLIAPNVDNYLPYAVLDYFDGRVKAGVMPQKGTAKDVADVSAATQLKVASSYVWLQQQRQVQLIRDIYANLAGGPLPVGDALRRSSEIDAIRVRGQNKNDATSRAALWIDGKPHVVEFPGDPGKLFEKALSLPEFYQHLDWLHATSRFTHQLMQVFTQLSPRFLLYRNVIRGFRTAGLKVGYLRAAEQMGPENFKRNLALAKNYADSAFGEPMLPEVRRMIDLEALPPPHLASGSVRDLPHQRELLVRGALPVFSGRKLAELLPEQQGKLNNAWQKVSEPMQKIFTTYEAFEKIYNYRAAMEKGLGEPTAAVIAARGGIPRPGVSGKWSSAVEVMFPWTRVRTQGIRASYDMFRDPRFGKAFATRFAIFEGLPRIAKVAVGMGLASKAISWFMRKDEDKNDPVWGEVARRVSPYKMALDDVVPMAFYDARTGQYHPFWEFKAGKDVPAHFEVVSIRLPASEEGQTFGNALYQTLVSIPGIKEQLGRPGQGIASAITSAVANMGPQLSPVIQTGSSLVQMILSGKNPTDPWSGHPSANPLMFDSGGVDRAQAVAGYLMNQAGGPGELAAVLAANLGLLDERARQALNYRLQSDKRPWTEKYPFLGAAISHDNYAQYRDEKMAELDEHQLRARARLLMPPELTNIYDFYYRNLKRKDKLDEFDQVRFGIASDYVNKIWGHLGKDDSFYGRAAHAISKDGSKEAKETFKRDLMTATEDLRAAWNTPP